MSTAIFILSLELLLIEFAVIIKLGSNNQNISEWLYSNIQRQFFPNICCQIKKIIFQNTRMIYLDIID